MPDTAACRCPARDRCITETNIRFLCITLRFTKASLLHYKTQYLSKKHRRLMFWESFYLLFKECKKKKILFGDGS